LRFAVLYVYLFIFLDFAHENESDGKQCPKQQISHHIEVAKGYKTVNIRVIMADVRDYDNIVTIFLLNTCGLCQGLTVDTLSAFGQSASFATVRASPDDGNYFTPTITGSVAEFYIQTMLSCVGDTDIMYHRSDELAIPAGTAPPTQLPDEFHSRVKVYEIVDSEFQGYVYLVSSYLLTECIDDGKYNAVRYQRLYL